MTPYKKSLLYTILFSLLITIFAAYDIRAGYNKEVLDVRSRVATKSFLIGEWIKSAFVASDYLLRDVISQAQTKELFDIKKELKTTEFLKSKLQTLPSYFKELGVANEECTATSGYVLPPRSTFIGVDYSDQVRCNVYMKNDKTTQYMSNSFFDINRLIVAQNRSIRTNSGKFQGLVGLIVELSFFQKWLNKLTIAKHSVLNIVDSNMILLARKPTLPDAIAKKVDAKIVEEFIASKEKYKTIHSVSLLDGINRVYGVRKVVELPFVIIVGEADEDWLNTWKQKTFGTIAVVFIFWILALLVLRKHWEQLELHEQLNHLANTDELTGIANRREFLHQVNQALKRVQRFQTTIAVLMLDIDKFKLINDNNGHATGDRAIIAFTKVCKETIRDIDVFGRLGGDEFAILLLNTDAEETHFVSERIRQAIESCEFFNDKGEALSMTSSIGVAMVDSSITTVNDMMAMADSAVYKAKETGRNSVVFTE
jgi:diguanylate cyclase (GGDEF)-like protein